jgi:uncharacterized membrane protein YidH (DUF202 family)
VVPATDRVLDGRRAVQSDVRSLLPLAHQEIIVNASAERRRKANRRIVVLGSVGLIVVGLLTFLLIQDSKQHAVVQSSIVQAKKYAHSDTNRMLLALYLAQLAENDRQEVVLFVIGLVTVLATVLAAFRFTSPEQSNDN